MVSEGRLNLLDPFPFWEAPLDSNRNYLNLHYGTTRGQTRVSGGAGIAGTFRSNRSEGILRLGFAFFGALLLDHPEGVCGRRPAFFGVLRSNRPEGILRRMLAFFGGLSSGSRDEGLLFLVHLARIV